MPDKLPEVNRKIDSFDNDYAHVRSMAEMKLHNEVHPSKLSAPDPVVEQAVLKDGHAVKAALKAHGPQSFSQTLRPLAEAFNTHHSPSERQEYKQQLVEYFSKGVNLKEAAATYATQHFHFDGHGGTKISRHQLEKIGKGSDLVGSVAAGYLLANLEKMHARIPGAAKLPVTELSQYDLHRFMEKGSPKFYERGTALYASADKLSSIRPEAVSQGDLGDCYFLAAVSALAAKHPENIRNMILDNRDGSYTVTFPGAIDTPVTVRASGHKGLDKYAHDTGYGTWAHILEKAHRRLTGRETNDSGGLQNDGLKLLTGSKIENAQFDESDAPETPEAGQPYTFNRGKTPLAQTEALLKRAEAYGFPTVAVAQEANGKDNDPGEIPGDHLYSVSHYNSKAKMVTLINPWEDKTQKYGSKFELPLKEFTNRFHAIAVADAQ